MPRGASRPILPIDTSAARAHLYPARRVGWPRGRMRPEESPDSQKQRCRVTPGRGNPTDSATEMKPLRFAAVRMKRWGKSPPRCWQQQRHGKPHREQCQIGTARQPATEGGAAFAPAGPGWQLEPVRQLMGKRNGHRTGGHTPGNRIRLIDPPRIFCPPVRRDRFRGERWGSVPPDSGKTQKIRLPPVMLRQIAVDSRPHISRSRGSGIHAPSHRGRCAAGDITWPSQPRSKFV